MSVDVFSLMSIFQNFLSAHSVHLRKNFIQVEDLEVSFFPVIHNWVVFSLFLMKFWRNWLDLSCF